MKCNIKSATLGYKALGLVLLSFCVSTGALTLKPTVTKLELVSEHIQMQVTPDIGGRVLSFSVPGKPNVLRLGKGLDNHPAPAIAADGLHIDYSGHIVWLGPQSGWWTHQNLNKQRRDKQARWPPDPYTTFAQNQVIEQTNIHISMQGVTSQFSGVQIDKTFTLADGGKAANLAAIVTNHRSSTISKDIWFNTRISPDASVYVATQSTADVRLDSLDDQLEISKTYSVKDGLLHMVNPHDFIQDTGIRQGKLFIQSTQGWVAAFVKQQLFIIQFTLEPTSSIHPEQGQVELYYRFDKDDAQAGLIELEVHSPYQTIAPAQSISAEQQWHIVTYSGPDIQSAEIAFLKQYLPF